MAEITFVRHGQASFGEANYDKLSPLGHQQSAWLGDHFKASGHQFDRVICGTLRRHRETLAGMQKSLNHPVIEEDERLNEMSYFAMERAYEAATGEPLPQDAEAAALYFSRVMHAWERDEISDIPESFTSFQSRILSAIADHSRDGQHLLMISSGGPLGVAMRDALGLDMAAMTTIILRNHNASYSRFARFENRYQLVQFNGIAHLEDPSRQHALTYI